MSGRQERGQRHNLNGIRAYLDLVNEHMREIANGRRVMWGHGRLSTRTDVLHDRRRGRQGQQVERTDTQRGQQ